MTPNDPGSILDITFGEGITLMYVHESHDHVILSVGGVAFFGENCLLIPVTPYVAIYWGRRSCLAEIGQGMVGILV